MTVLELAKYFFKKTGIDASRNDYSRTQLLIKKIYYKYDPEIICRVIDYLVDEKKAKMYSFQYVILLIDETVQLFAKQESVMKVREEMERIEQSIERKEAKYNVNSSKRNANKAKQLGTKPRFGTKSDFNLFAEPGQDS